MCLFLFSCTNNIQENNEENIEEDNNDFAFFCQDNPDRDTELKKQVYLDIKNDNSLVFVDNLRKCYEEINPEDYNIYSIPAFAIAAIKNESDIYYLKINDETRKIIVKKWTFYWENININFLNYRIVTFDENNNYILEEI